MLSPLIAKQRIPFKFAYSWFDNLEQAHDPLILILVSTPPTNLLAQNTVFLVLLGMGQKSDPPSHESNHKAQAVYIAEGATLKRG